MAKKYLDDNGLAYFWGKIKAAFLQDVTWDSTNNKLTKTKNGNTTDLCTVVTGVKGNSESTYRKGEVNITAANVGAAASSHTHGNITNDGKLQESDVAVANGDKLVITDSSASGAIVRSSIAFDTTTTGTDKKALSQKGTWVDLPINVQSDWNQTNTHADDYIKNKPSLDGFVPTSRKINDKALTSDITLYASDIPMSSLLSNQSVADEIDDIRNDMAYADDIGVANGICPLDANSKVDAQYLPSYVDDVVEAYARSGQTECGATWLATGSASGTVITPEAGVIYILMNDSTSYSKNTQFRWGGTEYVKLNDGGVTSITNGEIDTIVAS